MLEQYRQNYTLLNKSFTDAELIYPLGNRGFFSEVNNLALIVLYCLKNNIHLKLHSKKWSGGSWTTYFKPVVPEYNGIIPVPIDMYIESRKDHYFKKYHRLIKKRLIIQDEIWHTMRNEAFTHSNFSYPYLGIDGDIFQAKKQITDIILNFTTDTLAETTDLHPSIKEQVTGSCGLHIRRGDKVTGRSKEAEIFDIKKYVEKALEQDPYLTTFTVCTDDYEVVQDFKLAYPQFQILSLCPPNRNGYFQKEYNLKQTKAEKRAEVISILKDCHLLIDSKIFVGTYSSNVARYVALMRNGKECYSIDAEWNPF